MAQTLVCLRLHVVFSTKNRQPMITPEVEPELGQQRRSYGRQTKCPTGRNMSTKYPLSQRTFDRSVELIFCIRHQAMESKNYELLGMADRIYTFLLRLADVLFMKTRYLLIQETFDRLVELIRCVKRHASGVGDQQLIAIADELDALVRKLVAEVNTEASGTHTS